MSEYPESRISNPESPTRHVTIIGAGITGLATAYYLEKRGAGAVQYTLLDSSNRLGGKIITDHEDGFTIEGGPDSFVTEKPWCLQLIHDLGLAHQLIPSNEIQRKIYVLRNGRIVEFPSGFRLTIPTELKPFITSRLISPWGKVRMAMEYFLPPRRETGDESLASFIRRRLGNEALERFAGPLMAGIFVSDPERMSMMGTFPRLLEMERAYGSLIRAARAARRNPPPEPSLAVGHAMFNSLKGGLGAMVDALRAQLTGDIRLSRKALSIERVGPRWRVVTDNETVETDAVVCAVCASTAAGLLAKSNPRLAEKLAAIRFVGTATVSLAYLRTDIPPSCTLDGFGVLIPERENRDIIACTWASVKFKHRAPEGNILLRAFVGGPHREANALLPDDQLLALVRREYESLFGITREPLMHRIYRWPKGNPQYDVGHLDRVDEMERLAAETPGLCLAGSSYRGIGMPDCIKSGIGAVERILQ